MKLEFIHGDILDHPAEALVCSGNVYLNMSGGVNGALLMRGGEALQRQLHQYLQDQKLNFIAPGFVMEIGPEPFEFNSIVYSVAVDGWYDSSIELVLQTLTSALSIIELHGCKTVNVPALATGYGKLSKPDFGIALRRALSERGWNFQCIYVVERNAYGLEEIEDGYHRMLG
ncbi:macro domain-containing protein [Gimesia sp.]|uniref:macro domain-containing protein n=1 Tax=Gimesia sp. TaxID=2024833 RepID=UPI000C68DA5B|nr:macro domain-containing protein [Gimesia sp.]MAX40302.1 Appr-1-p processing protein [Gimesia sp.]HAH47187.1 Appr-1-p processing protein [Planctomycetaceae bacterium]HBL43559.1 Appr-1-p processing protein [Planctomycetaceae bacterium]|tara:strand:+ start:792 stop:1307 length:516 start_codon:yes stop_codon:yes gene_type:complete